MGCSTCADDVLVITEDKDNPDELLMMLAIASSYSGERRYNTYPEKTNIVCKRCSKMKDQDRLRKLGSTDVEPTSKTSHLGLVRSKEHENVGNISERISLARRTGYALMKSDFHGSNGLGPKISYQIYQSYILPMLA